jgi:GxxExxY protein
VLHENITKMILKAYFQVYGDLGYGFLERIYQIAIEMTLRELGLRIQRQMPIAVSYKHEVIGNYIADLVVNDLVIVEIKAAKALCEEHEAQVLNYLRATKYEVGLLLNFGCNPQFKRFIFDNWRKGTRTTRTTRINTE